VESIFAGIPSTPFREFPYQQARSTAILWFNGELPLYSL